MPSEVMDVKGLSSSSFFSEDAFFPNERQVGFWTKSNGKESLGSSSLENCQTLKSLDAKVRPGFNRQAVGAERALSHSLNLSRTVSLESIAKSNVNVETPSYYGEGGRGNMMGTQYESSLFSSSLSDLFSVNLRLSSNNTQRRQSVDSVASNYEEEEVFESLEEMEAQTIGNLLPSDDELLSGVTDGLECNVPLTASDSEELDIFSSSGGMDLGDDGLSNGLQYNGSVNGGHPHGEHPSRTLFVRNIISNIEDSELKTLFEQYGHIRTLYTACKHRGFVMISYYDIRAAWNAMKALQNKPLRRRKLDIHYSIPKDNASEEDVNQGIVVAISRDSSASDDELRELLGVYGEIKEILEIPNRMHQKFIEFYDIRAAETALNALNKSDIAGKRIKLEPCRPGCGLYLQQSSPSTKAVTGFSVPSLENMYHHGISSSVPNSLSSIMRVESAVSQSGLTESIHAASPLKYDIHGSPAFHPRSLPEYHNASPTCANCNSTGGAPGSMNVRQPDRNDTAFGSPGNVNCPNPGQHYAWNNSLMWSNSPSYGYGISAAPPPHRMHGLPRAPSHMFNPAMSVNNHRANSAPGPNSIWDPRQTFAGGSNEACGFHPGSLGNMRMSNCSPHSMEFVSHNMYTPHHQRCMIYPGRNQMSPVMNSFEQPTERPRNRRNDGCANQGDNKKQYELDIDRIIRGDDTRTTLMIKNIPNKYTSKMLLAAIDERQRGTYDFIYLPIDFKNKCNVGYAFINMTDPRQIIPFYHSFNGKKWEKFNSEKVASIAYARIQGKYALIAHFQNSSLMNEDKRCRPILFNTDGPNAGDQVPFPMGVNIRTRPGKSRTASNEENNGGIPPNSGDGEHSWNGGSSAGSKDSD